MSCRYNANVRIGNWYYDLILQEEKAKQYLKKNQNHELKVQKTRKAIFAMLKEVPLTFPVVGLSYGAVIQIVSPDVPPKEMFGLKEKQGIALACDIDFMNVDARSTVAHNDPVIGTGLLTPCVRNVWTLVPCDKSRNGKELRFGDSFYIQLYSSNPPLYVEAMSTNPTTPKGESGHVRPKLISWITTLTRFRVVNINPLLRYETEGSVVPPFEKVAIVQGANGVNLAVEPETWFSTFLGMECEISVHTYKDNKDPNRPDYRNFWSFFLSS